jgi:prepilin-type N-terminal cleavage/methylation domain-containing protein
MTMPEFRRRRPGMTLVEVTVVLGIMAVLTSALFSLLISSLWSWDRGSSKGQSDTTASIALQKVARAIVDGKSATVSSGQLTVQLPLVNDQGNYDRTSNGNTVKIYLTGTTLYQQINSGTAVSVSKDITAATFTTSNGSVTVSLTSRGQTGKNIMSTQLSQEIALRNYDAP